jgi:L-ascorbate metabolism protein UlaG (beta-lactamase superfamily)
VKITKLVHSCLLVEMPDRTALFDPGMMSDVNVDSLKYLDDIIVTHEHGDHISIPLISQLVAKFPEVRITTTAEIVRQLEAEGIKSSNQSSEGIMFFNSPHEAVEPLVKHPEQIGVHYLGRLSHPGDSHSFEESMDILALPVTAPWGTTIKAIELALKHKPKYVIPIHDWHWRDEAREIMYDRIEEILLAEGITFVKAKNGESFNLDV